jgi:hypothetical protein
MTDDKYGQSKSVDALNSRALSAKREYVRDLVNRSDPEAISLLVECLCDESWFLRDLAEQVFPRMGDIGASALVPLLNDGLWFSRTSAAHVLGAMGYGPAVPALLSLTDDANQTVADAAREALVAIGKQKGMVRIAHAIYRLPPDGRRRRIDEITARDRAMGERIERFLRSEEIMNVSDVESLSDDSPEVRSSEEGVEWEVLTGPPPPTNETGEGSEGRG